MTKQQKLWWLSLGVILILGAALRFIGYNFGLPYIDTPDEPTFFAGALIQRGLYNQPYHLPGYPPGILWVYDAAQVVVEQVTHQSALANPAATIVLIRIVSILVALLTVVVIGLLARNLGGDLAGLVAAAAWAVIPVITFHTLVAMPNSWLFLSTALALYWGIVALQTERPGWAIGSVLAALVAILFKYSAYLALAPGMIASLWWLWRSSRRSRWLKTFGFQILCTAACALWLFLGYHASDLTKLGPGAAVAQHGLTEISNVPLNINLLSRSIDQLGLNPFLVLGLSMAALVLCYKTLGIPRFLGWGIIAGFAVLSAWLTSMYLTYDASLVDYYLLPADIGFVILAGVVIAQTGKALGERLHNPRLQVTLPVLVSLIWLAPMAVNAWNDAQSRALPETRAALATWSVQAIGDGSILVDKYNWKTFNREWGGYTGPYRVWLREELTDHPLDYWREEHVNYAELNDNQVSDLEKSDAGTSYLANMLLLKTFAPPAQRFNWRGPGMSIYRLWNIQHPLDADFAGQIHLNGYDLDTTAVQPGNALQLVLYWHADKPPTDNYNVYIHVTPLDAQSPILTQADGAPSHDNRPTLTWTDPTETMISGVFQIALPADLKPGQYQIVVGLYNYQTGQRLQVGNQDFVQLSVLTVQSPDF